MRRKGFSLLLAMVAMIMLMGAACPPSKPPQVGTTTANTAPAEPTAEQKAAARLQEAEGLYQAGKIEEAIKVYSEIVKDYPQTGAAKRSQFQLGVCYLKLGKPGEASAQFKIYVQTYREGADSATAQDYIIQIREAELERLQTELEAKIAGLEVQNYRLEVISRYLQRSIDSEVVYIEIDIEADRLFVKIGTQTLYEYPIITGKGATVLRATGRVQNFDTPRGIRKILTIVKDPMWYRPDWVWLERGQRPPGPGVNRGVPYVLGPYKLTLGDGYAIHGTRAGTIKPGKVSHGCIRMNNKDIIQLAHLIEVGTWVYLY